MLSAYSFVFSNSHIKLHIHFTDEATETCLQVTALVTTNVFHSTVHALRNEMVLFPMGEWVGEWEYLRKRNNKRSFLKEGPKMLCIQFYSSYNNYTT